MLKYINIRNIAIAILMIAVLGLTLTGCKAFTVQTRTLIDYRYTPGHSYQTINDSKVVERYEPEKFELLWLYTYKGRPLMRKDNLIYYGSMADSHIIMLQILETKKVGDEDVASKVSIQLQLTDPAAKSRDRIVKKSEKDGLYTALDLGSIWLERALAGK